MKTPPGAAAARTGRPATALRAEPRFGAASDNGAYAVAALAAALAAAVAFAAPSRSRFLDQGQRVAGWASAILFAAALLFIARKRLHGLRLGQLRPLYLAHLWGGSLWGPAVLFHAGLRAPGPFYTTLALSVGLAWTSGLLLALYQLWLVRTLREGGLDAPPLDDLVEAQSRLLEEVSSLLEGQLPEVARTAREEVFRSLRGPRVLLALVRDPRTSARLREEVRLRVGAHGREEGEAMVLERLGSDAVELRRLRGRILMARLRAAAFAVHVAASLPALALSLVHVLASLRY